MEADLKIEFPGLGASAAGTAASRLADDLNDEARKIGSGEIASQVRERSDTQDLGTVVGVVLGAKATREIVKGITRVVERWLALSNHTSVRISHKDGRVIEIRSNNVKEIEKLLRQQR